jgi:hypothetical protein
MQQIDTKLLSYKTIETVYNKLFDKIYLYSSGTKEDVKLMFKLEKEMCRRIKMTTTK